MLVLGIQGSPRIGGNTNVLLSTFLDEARERGARTVKIEVISKDISPCRGCESCGDDEICTIDDDMREIYPLFRQADVIVLASPVYFFSTPASLKALIDRSQLLWVRKHERKIIDPGSSSRVGFLLSVGGAKNKNLFDGISLTAKYFFDAVGACDGGALVYREIEEFGDIAKHPSALKDVREKAREIISPLASRKKALFLCRENACRSQMAAAFARLYFGKDLISIGAGSDPASEIDSTMVQAMEEKGIDMFFLSPQHLTNVLDLGPYDFVISMGCIDSCPVAPGGSMVDWDIPDPKGRSMEYMRTIRDEIEKKVKKLPIDRKMPSEIK